MEQLTNISGKMNLSQKCVIIARLGGDLHISNAFTRACTHTHIHTHTRTHTLIVVACLEFRLLLVNMTIYIYSYLILYTVLDDGKHKKIKNTRRHQQKTRASDWLAFYASNTSVTNYTPNFQSNDFTRKLLRGDTYHLSCK